MFTNKHVVVAFIVAPILAVIAYFGVDYMVAEKPHSAQAGASYKLASRANCEHQSGICRMVNGDVELKLEWQADTKSIIAISNLPSQGIKLAFGDPNQNLPLDFTMLDESAMQWQLPLSIEPQPTDALHVVMSINNSFYFGEATAIFLAYETSYHKDFRSE
jgi:hypothetical protein